MRASKDLSMMLQTFQDPEMVAEACRDFYLECYERTNEYGAYLFGDEPVSSEWEGYPLPLTDIVGNGFYVDLNYLKELIDAVSDETINDDDLDAPLHLKDFWSDKYYDTTVAAVAEQLGQQSDSNYIMYAAYQALLDTNHSKTTRFFQNIMLYAQGKSQSVADALVKVDQYVAQGDVDLASANEALLQFGGVTDFVNNPQNGNNYMCDLQQYTGTPPINGVFTGLLANANTLIGKVGALILWQYEVSFKVIGATLGLVAKGVKKLFSWIGNYFYTSQVDPIDYKMLDDSKTMNTFAIPARMRYGAWAGSKAGGPRGIKCYFDSVALSFVEAQKKGDPLEYWFSFLGTRYRLTPSADFIMDANATSGSVTLERWIKPINPKALLTVLTENDFSTIGGMRDTLHALQRSDFSVDSKADELDVFKAIVLAHSCETSLYRMFYNNGLRWLYQGANNSQWEEEAPADDTVITSSLRPTGYLEIHDGLATIRSAAFDILNNWDDANAQIPFGGGLVKIADIKSTYLSDNSVTNRSFLRITTAIAGGVDWTSSGLSVMKDCTDRDYQYGGPIVEWEGDPSYMPTTPPPAPVAMIMWELDRSARRYHPDDRLVTIGYHHGQGDSKSNVAIKTDAENEEAATKAITNAIITIAAVAVTVYVGVKAVRLLRTLPKWQAQQSALRMRYGNAVADGDTTLADSLWKQERKLNLKLKCGNIVKGALLAGPSTALTVTEKFSNSKKQTDAQLIADNSKLVKSIEDTNTSVSDVNKNVDELGVNVNSQLDAQTKALVAAMGVQSAADIAQTIIILNRMKGEAATNRPSRNENGNW